MQGKLLLGLMMLSAVLAGAGCSGGENGCADLDVGPDVVDTEDDVEVPGETGDDADAPPTCSPPEVSCGTGEHSEYGLCIPDSEELELPGGTFDMGAPSGTDLPLHSVTLAGFRIDRTEITNARYQACVAAGCCTPPTYDGSYSGREPYYGNSEFSEFPVIQVRWDQARQFCEGQGKRLPTEAQWEYAARGTDGRVYPWGSTSPSATRANYDQPRDGDTEQTGQHRSGASAFDVQDMAGNVWEWVNDWYGATYYTESPGTDPPGPATGVARVARGGSFASTEDEIFAYFRTSYLPTESFSSVGFRCAR